MVDLGLLMADLVLLIGGVLLLMAILGTRRMDRDRFFAWILGHVIKLWGLTEK
ncbi:hypothetical protein SO802_009391 [Lithocarpus litseifolius]|uniref:NADH dehydrogenase subunit 1 n=1 Tax=Lithocarpus litseifolius TaxID=425828 RepID=A0AAW2DCB2_9ROSI